MSKVYMSEKQAYMDSNHDSKIWSLTVSQLAYRLKQKGAIMMAPKMYHIIIILMVLYFLTAQS